MKHPRLEPRLLCQPVHFFALGFGAGLSPKAPGTAGTLVAVPLVMAVASAGWWWLFAFSCVAFAAGIYVCGESARRLGVHDHPGIVWDEIAGFAVTMLAAPPQWHHTWQWAFAGFLLFRLFDIWKPWPIREADHSLTGGLGIMLDDILAGIFSALILLAYRHFF
jgi:phosphatidylglycerophosphatase A